MSFDDLTSIYRIESKSASLAEVRKDLYSALSRLSDDIHREYEKQVSIDPGSIVCEGINERRKKIVLYSQKIIDQRMEKIMRLALSGAMGADNVIDHLTEEEKEYYHCLLDSSKRHRALTGKQKVRPKSVALNVEPVTENAEPLIIEESVTVNDPVMIEPAIVEKVPEQIIESVEEYIDPIIADTLESIEDIVADLPQENMDEPFEEVVTIRVLEDLPPFSGPERDYDLKKEDIIRMPAVMANALISREKAIRLNVTP